jgi:molecular chaperone DnaK
VPQIEVAFDIDANGITHVSAKDLGTGKEQKITITGSGGLDENEIDRMVADAKEHGDDDRKRREAAEARNSLDSLVYSTEKLIEEHSDKLDAAIKADVESAIADGKKALEGESADEMKSAAERITQASHKLAESIYRTEGDATAGPSPGTGAGGDEAAAGGGSDDVIDAEFVDVDDKAS